MFVTILNDCADPNTAGRQMTRAAALFGVTPVFVPLPPSLDDAAQLTASGMLVDVLDAAGEHEGVVLVNVAPRNGAEKHWGNGTPFGFFRIHHVLVVTTLSGLTLSLPYRCGLVGELQELDLEKSVELMIAEGSLTSAEGLRIKKSQFRSFDFLPRIAQRLFEGGETVHVTDTQGADELGLRVWLVDSFGNCKTTLTEEMLDGAHEVKTRWGVIPFVRSLKDVPDGETAVIVGSSGYNDTRFLEIVIQGASAAARYGISGGEYLQ